MNPHSHAKGGGYFGKYPLPGVARATRLASKAHIFRNPSINL